jgi:hypothetical protein
MRTARTTIIMNPDTMPDTSRPASRKLNVHTRRLLGRPPAARPTARIAAM